MGFVQKLGIGDGRVRSDYPADLCATRATERGLQVPHKLIRYVIILLGRKVTKNGGARLSQQVSRFSLGSARAY